MSEEKEQKLFDWDTNLEEDPDDKLRKELTDEPDGAIPDGTVHLPSMDEYLFETEKEEPILEEGDQNPGIDIPPLSEIPVPEILAGAYQDAPTPAVPETAIPQSTVEAVVSGHHEMLPGEAAPASPAYPGPAPVVQPGSAFSSPVDAVAAAAAAASTATVSIPQLQNTQPAAETEETDEEDAGQDVGYNGYPIPQRTSARRKKKKRGRGIRGWAHDHMRILMPLILIIALLVTIRIATSANRRTQTVQSQPEMAAVVEQIPGMQEVPLHLNEYEDLNELIRSYFDAYADGDLDTLSSLTEGLTEDDLLRIQATGEHILSYSTVDVYSKEGPVPGSYVVYAYTEEILNGYDSAIPGMTTMYVQTREDGSLAIAAQLPSEIVEYIQLVTIQDDVVDLNNRVTAKYNEMLAADPELDDYIDRVTEDIRLRAAQMLAEQSEQGTDAAQEEGSAEAGEEEPQEETTGPEEEQEAEPETAENAPAIGTAHVREAVNLRRSAGATGEDPIDTLYQGDEVEILANEENGWSHVRYNGQEGYIKTEFLTD